jgi:hypothetical protein
MRQQWVLSGFGPADRARHSACVDAEWAWAASMDGRPRNEAGLAGAAFN